VVLSLSARNYKKFRFDFKGNCREMFTWSHIKLEEAPCQTNYKSLIWDNNLLNTPKSVGEPEFAAYFLLLEPGSGDAIYKLIFELEYISPEKLCLIPTSTSNLTVCLLSFKIQFSCTEVNSAALLKRTLYAIRSADPFANRIKKLKYSVFKVGWIRNFATRNFASKITFVFLFYFAKFRKRISRNFAK
jgi:hypothetical protein